MFGKPEHEQIVAISDRNLAAKIQLSRFSEVRGRSLQLVPLGSAGGFSGGAIWRVETDSQRYALRLWPRETTTSRISFVHSLQRQWREANLKFIPSLFTTEEGESFAKSALGFWELAEWMPGEPLDPALFSPPQRDGVAAALAAIHAATQAQATLEPSPGLRQRLEMLTRWQATDLAQIERQIEKAAWPEFAARARQTLALFPHLAPPIRHELSAASKVPLPLQECLRDIHRDHIFLTGAFVTGVIDFGAVRRESCAGDLARLCGSLFENDPGGWDDFLTRYELQRPLSPAERRAIAIFDRSAALLTGLQWIEWIAVEKRSFPQPEAVLNRLDISLRRMRFLLK